MFGHQPISASRRREVAAALSHYLGLGQDEEFFRFELRRDLGLEPLDLVLFVLNFEEAEGLSFPFEALEGASTVAELVYIMAAWLDDYDSVERIAEADDAFGENLFCDEVRRAAHV